MKFDFKDLMAFGMFILALLTFVLRFVDSAYLKHRKTTLYTLTGHWVAFL